MSKMLQTSKESPKVKEGEIFLVRQDDGNWKGFILKQGNPVEVRDIDPYTCLTLLLTLG